MSGRLIITSKKGYCPWSSKNLSRVARDERELQEREQKRKREVEQSERIEKLKRQNGDQDFSNDGPSAVRHINLFEQEERSFLEDAKLGQETIRTSPSTSKQVGIMPVFLSQMKKDDEQKQQEIFYKRNDILRKETDDKLKKQMDPMYAFHKDKTSRSKDDGDQIMTERVHRKEKKKKKSKKHKKRSSVHDKETNDSKDVNSSKLEELRKRKADRTKNELKREEKIQRK